MTDEERRLGLDPSKYTKKPFNPQDSFGYATERNNNPLFQVIEEMRNFGLENEQSEAMGQYLPKAEMTTEEIQDQKRRMLQRMME